MRISSRWAKRLGVGLAVVVAAVIVVRTWVIPAVIVGQVQAMVAGKVTIRDWWIDGHSAGVVGLALHEGPTAGSPVFASAERVATDLSLLGLLRGRVAPGLITLVRPEVHFRLDRNGRFANMPVFRGGAGSDSRVPSIAVEGATVCFRREGRPEMVVSGVDGRLASRPQRLDLSAGADDPTWGRWEASGRIDPSFRQGSVRLEGDRFAADRAKLERIPFIPEEVWTHVVPRGPVDVLVRLDWSPGKDQPTFATRTEVTLREVDASFPTLGFDAAGTSGRLEVVDGVVHVDKVEGRAIGGKVAARGTLDFVATPPHIDLNLDLARINVADAPRSWQLYEAEVTGRLTGKVHLLAVLNPKGVDLSGSSGEAVVEDGTIQGIPVKSLTLAMSAQGDDLRYSSGPSASRARGLGRRVAASLPLFHAGGWGWLGLAWAAGDLIALQPPAAPKAPAPSGTGIQFPKAITTHLELEDVDIQKLVAKAQYLTGFPLPIPISGRLSVKAEATIPLGALRDVKAYAFHGDLTLTGASIDRVDFGRLESRIDLANGVLELSDLRGRLVDHPNGGPDNPPQPTGPAVAATGPLPPGGFRSNVRAELSPPGKLSVTFDGDQLPLGELAAPALPRPTPLSGLATMHLEARADLGAARRPEAWTASGQAESRQITYRGAALDRVALRFALKDSKLDVPSFAAELAGHPLSARGGLDLKPPQAFDATLDVTGWDLAAALALVPSAPRPSPVSGAASAHAEARGTLAPLSVETTGQGSLGRFQAGPVALGDVPFRWASDRDVVTVSGVEAHPFGGRLAAEARVPLVAGRPTEGSATFQAIDTAQVGAAIPGRGLQLTGKADGWGRFSIPADVSALEATVGLSAPDLTVQGIPAEQVQASLHARKGTLRYELTADSLGGKVKFEGDFPLTASPAPAAAQGEFQAVGFRLDALWKALGVTGAVAQVKGLGAINANIRDTLAGADAGLWAHGVAEFRNLSWGTRYPLGQLRGTVALSPTIWRIDPLTGELLGGLASGFAWGTTPAQGPRRMGFQFRIDRAALSRMLAFLPLPARSIEGLGSFRVDGGLEDVFNANAVVTVTHAKLAGLPLSELRAPAEVVLEPATGSGVATVRSWSARLAGGQVRGDARLRLGNDRSFQTQVQLTGVDLQAITRLQSDVARPASGKIAGRINLTGTDPAQPQSYRGKVVLDLDDASLVSVPVFREINRFLGAARDGLFEDGDLIGTIANRHLIVEMFTLEGRLVQLRATGTVGFDGLLNLEVLINTNQIIPETGQALVARIPGLRDVLGRSRDAMLKVSNFLSNRLLKLRVSGTIRNPSVAIDPSIVVAETAVAFFAGVLKLPLWFLK